MRPIFCLLPTLVLSTLAAAQATAPTGGGGGAAHLAGELVNDARDALRDPNLPAETAAAEATALLRMAVKLDGTNLAALHLLARSAQAAGKTEAQRDALRAIIAADTGDLVAQSQYIDLLASEWQNVEDRMAMYRGALGQNDLNAQVRSEAAVKLARLAEARGDAALCRDYLNQAVRLNDVNVGALRDLVRLAAAAPAGPDAFVKHVQALVALLSASPYQPDAWLQTARICAAANVPDRAAEFLETAAEQLQMAGNGPAGDLYLELALEEAIAGQNGKAYGIMSSLAQLPDAPLEALLTAELLSHEMAPAATVPAGTQAATQRVPEIRKRLAALAGQKDNAAALADAAGADLTTFAAAGEDTAAWVAAYEKLVKPADLTLGRLKGWLFYRQGKLAEAQGVLEKCADPLAQAGLARVLLAQGKALEAGKILQGLWNGNPTGLLALQIVLAARAANVTLADSASGRQVRPLIGRLTPAVSGMHRQPKEAQLIMTSFRKPAVGPGEAALLQVRITNTTDRALPVGEGGIVKATLGLAAVTRGAVSVPVGLYAVEDLQRVYRLEPRQMMEGVVRVDQGRLADLLEGNLGATVDANVTVVTVPRVLNATEFTAGLGGQVVVAGEFERGGLAVTTAADVEKLVTEVGSLTGERQLVRIEAAGGMVGRQDEGGQRLAAGLAGALAAVAGSKDAVVRAALVRAVPGLPTGTAGGTAELEKALAGLGEDGEALVRLMWVRREARLAGAEGAAGGAALAALEKRAGVETDEVVKDYLGAAVGAVKGAGTKP